MAVRLLGSWALGHLGSRCSRPLGSSVGTKIMVIPLSLVGTLIGLYIAILFAICSDTDKANEVCHRHTENGNDKTRGRI